MASYPELRFSRWEKSKDKHPVWTDKEEALAFEVAV